MTMVAAEGRVGMPGAIPELGGRKPQLSGNGAANVTGRTDNSCPKTDGLMAAIVSRGNMMAAYTRVMRNKGAPGVDDMPVTALKGYLQEEWRRIREALLAGKYTPLPVRKVEIPKPGGGTRLLGIPTVLDRLIQQAVNQVLRPLFDPEFSNHSYGFRPGRSAHQAVNAARQYVGNGRRWVVDMDLEKFFDRVNHDILMSLVKRKVKDRQVLKLIDSYLKAGMFEGGIVSPRQEGPPQGGPLSPLLSNILLDELDKELEKRGQWRRAHTRAKNLIKLGLSGDASWRLARNQRGPWWHSGTNVIHRVLPQSYFDSLGLISLLDQYNRLQHVS